MPHIIIEHPKNNQDEINLSELSLRLHNCLSEHETISKSAIKTRTIEVDNIVIGEGSDVNKFVHITLLLLPGRKQELKDLIVRNIYKEVSSLIANKEYVLSVELRELATYYKGI